MGTGPKEITQTASKGATFSCRASHSDNQEALRHARAKQTAVGVPAENDPAVMNHPQPRRGHQERGAGTGHLGIRPLMRGFNPHVKADQEQEQGHSLPMSCG